MKYALIVDGVVSQIQPNSQDGFIKVDDLVVCGMIQEGGAFVNPPAVEQSIQQQVDDLENSITKRNLRGLRIGDQWAIDEVAKIDAAVELLRKGL